ncbi:Protein-lysine N-methyltransferase efm5 [Paramarasmius palmivorus]|uniref:Protein-lysine N-methyltransferase efm5 n=1 Tax=Paramarasmius palmivorus TaxID=297713 RepID=A0AAW0C6W2_9AGAR
MLKLESPRAIPLANAADFEFSSSPTSSVSLSLDSNTQSILHSFLAERDQERALFNQFQLAAYGGVPVVASTPPNEVGELEKSEEDEDEEIAPSMMSLTDYRLAFREDWQLSQFWYSNAFAEKLAHWLHCLSATSNPKIAFISSPTAFVAFQSLHPSPHARLLEYDERLRVLDPKRFVSYDLDEPEDGIPDGIKEKMDIVVVDPPYLNELSAENKLACISYCTPTSASNNGQVGGYHFDSHYLLILRTLSLRRLCNSDRFERELPLADMAQRFNPIITSTVLCNNCQYRFKSRCNSSLAPDILRSHRPPSITEASQTKSFLEQDELELELERYDVELGRIRSIAEELETERKLLWRRIQERRSWLAPIRRLPTEVLEKILYLVREGDNSRFMDFRQQVRIRHV